MMKAKANVRKQGIADRVLIIEGKPILSELAHTLTRAGFKVVHIPNSPETLLMLSVFKPDIVVFDDTIGDSIEACRQIQSTLGTPALLVSEDRLTDIWTNAFPEGCTKYYVGKPVDDGELVARITAMLAYYHNTRCGFNPRRNQVCCYAE